MTEPNQPSKTPLAWKIFGKFGEDNWIAGHPKAVLEFNPEASEENWLVAEYVDAEDGDSDPFLVYDLQYDAGRCIWSLWRTRLDGIEPAYFRVAACIWPKASPPVVAEWIVDRYFAARSRAGYSAFSRRIDDPRSVESTSEMIPLSAIEARYWGPDAAGRGTDAPWEIGGEEEPDDFTELED